jgi:hypothetical protein
LLFFSGFLTVYLYNKKGKIKCTLGSTAGKEERVKQQNRMMVEAASSICKKTLSKGILLYGDMVQDYAALA